MDELDRIFGEEGTLAPELERRYYTLLLEQCSTPYSKEEWWALYEGKRIIPEEPK